ncbi:hypothetical protein GCM10008932_00910 [Alkalibacterium iburiense]|uniref:YcxB-like C-terminal domain-containing protein n=1 Tax=Alkalibacterium iburiense TaxID=290589 RepID=A0ABN0X0S0_9LACT
MEITYELEKEDYILFNLYHIEHSPSQKKLLFMMRIVLPIVFAIPIYILGTSIFNQPGIYWIIVSLLFVVGWMIYYPKEQKRSVRKQTEKLLNEGDNTSLFGKKKLVVDEFSITITGGHSTEVITVDTIQSVKVYDEMILLYNSSISAHIIPTRFMDGETKKTLLAFFNK